MTERGYKTWFQAVARIVFGLEIALFFYVLWSFVGAQGSDSFADLGAAAMSLMFGVPLGALGAFLFLPVRREGRERFSVALLVLSLATIFQVAILVARGIRALLY